MVLNIKILIQLHDDLWDYDFDNSIIVSIHIDFEHYDFDTLTL